MNKEKIISQFKTLWAITKTKQFKLYVASAPLFFSWVPVYSWNSEERDIVRICLYSAVNTCLFFLGLVFLHFISIFPFIGAYLASIAHFFLVILYLGLSGFLIYSIRLKKTIDIPVLSEWVDKLFAYIAPIAQLDRVSDYGSEG